MINFVNKIKSYFTEQLGVTNMASIVESNSGFELIGRDGVIQTYSRRRDAVRGARRRGLEIA